MLRAKSSQLSFYGNHIYDRVIPETHFLKLLDKVADFPFVNELCRDAYTPDFGRPAYEPEMMFKILFLQFLYDISDRRVEEEVNFNLVLKWFVGLTIEECIIKLGDSIQNNISWQLFCATVIDFCLCIPHITAMR